MQQIRGLLEFDLNAINNAFETYEMSDNEHRLRQLLESVASTLNWDVGRANKIVELTWECGLLIDKGRALTKAIFIRYVLSMIEHQCVLVSVRPPS